MRKALPCLALALTMGTPAIALSGPAGGQPDAGGDPAPLGRLESMLVVRVKMEGGEAVAELLREDLVASLREARVMPELPDDAPLELVVSTDEASVGTYEVVYLHRGVIIDEWACTCSGEELRSRLETSTPAAWHAAVAAAAPAPAPAVVATPPPKDPGPGMGEPGHRMWLAGLGTTAIGTGMAVSMSVLLILPAADGKEVERLPVGLLATGVVMAATGGVLWGLANRKRKRAYLGMSAGQRLLVTLQGRF